MSLNARERRTLHSIGDRISGSDPKLASLLATFTRLTSAEAMPPREKIALRHRLRAIRGRHPRLSRVCRRVGEVDRRLSFKQSGLLLWLAITLGLIAIALTVSNIASSPAACTPGAACSRQTSAHVGSKPASHPGAPLVNLQPSGSAVR